MEGSQPGVEVFPRRQWKLKPAAGGAGRCTPLQLLFLKLQVKLHTLDLAPRCASLPFWLVWNGSSQPGVAGGPTATSWTGGGTPQVKGAGGWGEAARDTEHWSGPWAVGTRTESSEFEPGQWR